MVVNKNILVIGSKDHSRATKCVKWGEAVYVGDYDVVIIDTRSLTSEILFQLASQNSTYLSMLCRTITDVQEKIGINIICIISPYAFLRKKSDYSPREALTSIPNNYSWCPIIPFLEEIPLATKFIHQDSSVSKTYLNLIKNYSLLHIDNIDNYPYSGSSFEHIRSVSFSSSSLLQNNTKRDIAFTITWKGYEGGENPRMHQSRIPVKFLPPTNSIHEGIDVLIEEFLATSKDIAPEWISEIALPGEHALRQKITIKTKSIQTITDEIIELNTQLNKLYHFKKLLYTQGDELLEIVKQAFEFIGLTVQEPAEKNIEDYFFITSDGHKIYFEVRGVDNRGMNEKDLNQLIQRLADQPQSAIYLTRGVFIFNHHRKLPPTTREIAFHPNIEQKAKSFNICLIDTTMLFNLVAQKMSQVDSQDFSESLLNTTGIFNITLEKFMQEAFSTK